MMRRQRMRAMVLSRRAVNEADRLVTLLTDHSGLIRVLAKGVRKIPSRRGGHLEPFTEVVAIVSGRPGSHYVAAVETVDYFKELHVDRDAMGRGNLLTRLLVGVIEEEVVQDELYSVVRDVWQLLPELPQAKRDVLEVAATLTLLRYGGLLPDLLCCRVCGERRPSEAVVLDATRDGWLCLSCYPQLMQAVLSVTERELALLRYAASHPAGALKVRLTREQGNHVREAMRNYVIPLLAGQKRGEKAQKIAVDAGRLRYHKHHG